MAQKLPDAPRSSELRPADGGGVTSEGYAFGPSLRVVRFMVNPDFRGKTSLSLPTKATSNVFGERNSIHPNACPLEGVEVDWFPREGILRFRKRRVESVELEPGAKSEYEFVEEKWLPDSTDALQWWETRSQVKLATPQSK